MTIKRFKSRELYTLCLVNEHEGEIYTWCANVTYKDKTKEGLLEFVSSETRYYIDPQTNLVSIEIDEVVYVGGDEEYDIIPQIHFAHLTNIVKGWQF